jgi:hypothetical protein
VRGRGVAIKTEFAEGRLGVGVNSFNMTLVPLCKMVEASITGVTKRVLHKYRTLKIKISWDIYTL